MNSNQKSSLFESIFQNMKLKETEELLAIWSDNDRLEWSDEAFEIIHAILLERLGNVPPQESPMSTKKHRKPKKKRKSIFLYP
jgi:hypothetical protein